MYLSFEVEFLKGLGIFFLGMILGFYDCDGNDFYWLSVFLFVCLFVFRGS